MANLSGRPVRSKAEDIAEWDAQKAQRKAERGITTKERHNPEEAIKAAFFERIRESGHRAAEAFIAKYQGYNQAVFADGRMAGYWEKWKARADTWVSDPPPAAEMDHQDYVAAWAELGAAPAGIGKWSNDAQASARAAAKSYRKHPGIDWTQTRAIVAKLGTCAWLAHIAHLDGDTIHVLWRDWQESQTLCTDSWAAYVAKDLSKLIGRTLKGIPCVEARVGYTRRTCK